MTVAVRIPKWASKKLRGFATSARLSSGLLPYWHLWGFFLEFHNWETLHVFKGLDIGVYESFARVFRNHIDQWWRAWQLRRAADLMLRPIRLRPDQFCLAARHQCYRHPHLLLQWLQVHKRHRELLTSAICVSTIFGEKKCNCQTDGKDALSWCAPISYLHQPEDSGTWGRQRSELCSYSDHDESFYRPQGAVPPAICHTRRTFRWKTWLQKPRPWRQSDLIFSNSAINFSQISSKHFDICWCCEVFQF